MGAKAGRRGSKKFNVKSYGDSVWRKWLEKRKRKTAKTKAIKEQEAWLQAGAEAFWKVEEEINKDDTECRCGLIIPNKLACRCGCGYCCPKERVR